MLMHLGLLAVTGAEWAGVGDAVIEGLRGRAWKVWLDNVA